MIAMRQGEIWWADLPPPSGRRPVLLLTRSEAIPRLSSVTIAPITRSIRLIQSEVELSPLDGMQTECAISLDNILTVHKDTLSRRIARLGDDRMADVFSAIRFACAMP